MEDKEINAKIREMRQLKIDHPEDTELWDRLIKIYKDRKLEELKK